MRDDRGVSPVIGSILVLVIMIFAIGGILVWGAPAIDALQRQAQVESVTSQFLQTNADVRSLWDPQNSKVATISFRSGDLLLRAGDRWVVSGAKDVTGAHDGLRLSGWETGSPTTVTMMGAFIPLAASKKITASIVEGSIFTEVSSCTGGGCSNTISFGDAAAVCPWVGGSRRACLDTDVVRLQVTDDTVVKAESWIYNVGRLTYKHSGGDNQVHMEMGAVITESGGGFYSQQSPSIKDPDYSASVNDNNLYVRLVQLKGPDSGTGGSGRFPITFALQDNYGPARGRPLYDENSASMVRLQLHGDLEEAFCNLFDARAGWEQRVLATDADIAERGDCSGEVDTRDVNVFYDRAGQALQYHLNHAQVNVHV